MFTRQRKVASQRFPSLVKVEGPEAEDVDMSGTHVDTFSFEKVVRAKDATATLHPKPQTLNPEP